jgi:endonuclease YncB( thermonuclease family)
MIGVALQWQAAVAACLALFLALFALGQAHAAGCMFTAQGEGRVAAVIDARSFRLEDGREIRLAGIEPANTDKAKGAAALAAVIGGRDVTLHGEDDTPDRYGRQTAFVFLAETPVQSELLRRGEALFAADVADKNRSGTLADGEAAAIKAKIGIWSAATAIKNAESPGDILAGIGRFTVVEGKVLSVRQAGQPPT